MKILQIFIMLALLAGNAYAECTKIAIKNSRNFTLAEFNIENAITKAQQMKGLMHRKKLDTDTGMLFTWPNLDYRHMWMKNTHISLDILFIKEEQIVGIIPNTTPFSLRSLGVNEKSNQVLEINAGLTKSKNIKTGNVISCIEKNQKKRKPKIVAKHYITS